MAIDVARLEKALGAFLQKDRWTLKAPGAQTQLSVHETNDEGKATLIVEPGALTVLQLMLEGDQRFKILAKGTHCDGYLLVDEDDGICAHVIELKKARSPYEKAIPQLEWGLLRLHMVAHLLGLAPTRSRATIAYGWSLPDDEDPVRHRTPNEPPECDDRILKTRIQIRAQRLQADPSGEGRGTLSLP